MEWYFRAHWKERDKTILILTDSHITLELCYKLSNKTVAYIHQYVCPSLFCIHKKGSMLHYYSHKTHGMPLNQSVSQHIISYRETARTLDYLALDIIASHKAINYTSQKLFFPVIFLWDLLVMEVLNMCGFSCFLTVSFSSFYSASLFHFMFTDNRSAKCNLSKKGRFPLYSFCHSDRCGSFVLLTLPISILSFF